MTKQANIIAGGLSFAIYTSFSLFPINLHPAVAHDSPYIVHV